MKYTPLLAAICLSGPAALFLGPSDDLILSSLMLPEGERFVAFGEVDWHPVLSSSVACSGSS